MAIFSSTWIAQQWICSFIFSLYPECLHTLASLGISPFNSLVKKSDSFINVIIFWCIIGDVEVKKFKKPALQIKLAPTAGVCDLSPKYDRILYGMQKINKLELQNLKNLFVGYWIERTGPCHNFFQDTPAKGDKFSNPLIKAVEKNYTNWSNWTRCSKSCEGGFRWRERACKIEGKCSGEIFQRQLCNTAKCPGSEGVEHIEYFAGFKEALCQQVNHQIPPYI